MATIVHRRSYQCPTRVRRKSHPPVMKTFETKRWARLVESEMDHGAEVLVPRELAALLETRRRHDPVTTRDRGIV